MNRLGTVFSAAAGVAFLTAAGLSAGAAKGKGPLDGKTFEIKVGQEGKPQNDDKLVFADSLFSSDKLTPLGFGKVKYTTGKAKGSDFTFSAELHSTKEGKTSWKGTIKGDAIGGIMIWNKEGQPPVKYVFTGSLTH
ncbi:MAG TPA: hypothetical protein VKN99_22275 [Polyangia bacterium]|nr:hypothetical protein [Polyangia bacterium]